MKRRYANRMSNRFHFAVRGSSVKVVIGGKYIKLNKITKI